MKNTTDTQTIYFDLDGTLYDLYGQDGWLERITTLADPTAYANDAATMLDMDALHAALRGRRVGVITWLARNATPEYAKATRRVKREWIRKHLPEATEIHIVKYGTPKHRIAKSDGILVDDDATVRAAWNRGMAIHPSEFIERFANG